MATTCQKLELLLWKNWKTNIHHKWRLFMTLITPIVFALLAMNFCRMSNEEEKSLEPGEPKHGGPGPGGPELPDRLASKNIYWYMIFKNSSNDYINTRDNETVKDKRHGELNFSMVRTPARSSERADAVPSLLDMKFGPELDATNYLMVAKSPRRRRQTPPQEVDTSDILVHILWTTCTFGFICCCTMTVKSIASEKENQIKETLKIMGMPYWINWLAWFIVSMIIIVIPTIAVTLVYLSCFTKHYNFIILFILLILFGVALTCFCFMISTFFDTANNAALLAQVVYVMFVVIHLACAPQFKNMPLVGKLFLSLSFISAVGFGLRIVELYESYHGLSFENVWTPPGNENVAMGYIWIMLILDSLIYLLIALYVEQVSQGEYGRSQPWNFCFLKSYWKPQKHTPEPEVLRRVAYYPDSNEPQPDNEKLGIRTLNLTKVFGSNHEPVVENLNLDIYKNQITVLLGENGAGKTTTLSMLIGMATPTRGTAEIDGYDIVKNIDDARRSLGFCPQHNIHFEELTVRDHLKFYCKLKGFSGDALNEEIEQYLLKINLKDKENKKPATLSGGMQRKLSVCLALCGKSKVVVLDEPSAGIDPSARCALWDLLQGERSDRTILISTHNMEEADLLGDRIAIIADGRLQCSGTPFFLKKRFSAGYRLVVVKDERCDVNGVTRLLKRHIPALTLESNVGSELSYRLNELAASMFEPMLADLENNGKRYGVISFGIWPTTMEDVFIKVGERSNQTFPVLRTHQLEMGEDRRLSVLKRYLQEDRDQGYRLQSKLRALFLKKLIILEREWIAYLLIYLVPVFLLILGIIVERASDDVQRSSMGSSDLTAIVTYSIGYFGVPIAVCYFILFLVKERMVMFKHLQFLSGADAYLFWGVHFVFDFIALLPIWILIIITLASFQQDYYSTTEELGRLFVVFICYACAILPFTYMCSFCFKSTSAGFIGMFFIHLVTGALFFTHYTIVGIFEKSSDDALELWIFLLFPPFCFLLAMQSLEKYSQIEEMCLKNEAFCPQEITGDYFQWEKPGIGKPILFLLLMGALYFIIILLLDSFFFQRITFAAANLKECMKRRKIKNENEEIDEDVLRERETILSASIRKLKDQYPVVLRNVSKYYGKFVAVNRISVGVERGECFGLVGTNGAGKTTTFRMMTGASTITKGEGYLEGLSLKKNIRKIQKFIGYCPQEDPLIDVMTPKETVCIICLLIGIPRKTIPQTIKGLLVELNLTQYQDKKIKNLSGGNKRKLSVGVSLVGNAPVLFLDEPSTGMDPLSKRLLWNAIIKSREKGNSVILTSHNMEECEALCSRLVIMMNGSFKCIGSVQYLKGKFAEGTILTIKEKLHRPSRIPDSKPIKTFVKTYLPGAILKEEYKGLLKYYLPKSKLTWSQMFGLMEKAKKEFDIEYAIGQTSLEQVFLTVTSQTDTEQ